MVSHEFLVEKTARYYTHGNSDTAKRVWICLHGYGQLGQYFIRNFEELDPEENFVICPEGFHRFYLQGFSGRVGASWMTKESRLTDIEDYIRYLDAVYDRTITSIQEENIEVILFGFSQGVATASRWIAMGGSNFDQAVFWAGSFPPDLPPTEAEAKFQSLPVTCVIGDSDEFINDETIETVKGHLAALNIDPKWVHYSGGHLIPKAELKKLSSSI